jgi:hypothetical protein
MELEGHNFNMDDEAIKQFRNSIYNFNRIGVPKVQARAKIYTKDDPMDTGMTSERYDEAKKRYHEGLG